MKSLDDRPGEILGMRSCLWYHQWARDAASWKERLPRYLALARWHIPANWLLEDIKSTEEKLRGQSAPGPAKR